MNAARIWGVRDCGWGLDCAVVCFGFGFVLDFGFEVVFEVDFGLRVVFVVRNALALGWAFDAEGALRFLGGC